tara:strand:+ start:56 stop:244 length:189 start_codon:yes stop_codon:yes gene_type:complete
LIAIATDVRNADFTNLAKEVTKPQVVEVTTIRDGTTYPAEDTELCFVLSVIRRSCASSLSRQ